MKTSAKMNDDSCEESKLEYGKSNDKTLGTLNGRFTLIKSFVLFVLVQIIMIFFGGAFLLSSGFEWMHDHRTYASYDEI